MFSQAHWYTLSPFQIQKFVKLKGDLRILCVTLQIPDFSSKIDNIFVNSVIFEQKSSQIIVGIFWKCLIDSIFLEENNSENWERAKTKK